MHESHKKNPGADHILCLTESNDPVYTKIARGMRDAASRRGYHPIPGIVPIDPRAELLRLTKHYGTSLAGIALQPYRPNRELAQCLLCSPAASVPAILVGHYYMNMNISACVVDNYAGMYAMTEHLIKMGRKRLCYLGEVSTASTEHDRLMGFVMACLHHGIQVPADWISCAFNQFDLDKTIDSLIHLKNPPDAILGLYDSYALRVMAALRSYNIRVPEDVAIFSFGDDEDLAEKSSPSLSTVSNPAYAMGYHAVDILIDQIEGRIAPTPGVFVVPVTLTIRESCGTPRDQYPFGLPQSVIPFSNFIGTNIETQNIVLDSLSGKKATPQKGPRSPKPRK